MVCLDECCSTADCPTGYTCVSGTCVTPAFFLVDSQDQCVSANHEVGGFAEVGSEPCDYMNAPNKQLWHQDTHNMIHSDVDVNRCMIAGPGEDIFSGIEIHIAPCKLNTFLYDSALDQMHLGQNMSYCPTVLQPTWTPMVSRCVDNSVTTPTSLNLPCELPKPFKI